MSLPSGVLGFITERNSGKEKKKRYVPGIGVHTPVYTHTHTGVSELFNFNVKRNVIVFWTPSWY